MPMEDYATPVPMQPIIVSEKGTWQRWILIILLTLNLILPIVQITETNENESRSREARPLVCSLAVDDAMANPAVAEAYEEANCPDEFGPLDEVAVP